MIKFIASDLDGTLLDGERKLPREIVPLIEELYARGILFAPASGRQYANLRALFSPVADKILFIAENGALVKYREETLFLRPVEDALIKPALDEIRAIPNLFPMLCGTDCAYIENDNEPFAHFAYASYTACKRVENLDAVIGREAVCKIAVYDAVAAADNCMKILPQRLPYLRTMISGFDWCDVSDPDTNKGAAIAALRARFGWKREECMAFGDHMNDYEMLEECGRAFVPENAYPPLKTRFPHTVPANTRGGVVTQIKKILAEELK